MEYNNARKPWNSESNNGIGTVLVTVFLCHLISQNAKASQMSKMLKDDDPKSLK